MTYHILRDKKIVKLSVKQIILEDGIFFNKDTKSKVI